MKAPAASSASDIYCTSVRTRGGVKTVCTVARQGRVWYRVRRTAGANGQYLTLMKRSDEEPDMSPLTDQLLPLPSSLGPR